MMYLTISLTNTNIFFTGSVKSTCKVWYIHSGNVSRIVWVMNITST